SVEYARSTSNTVTPTSGWQATTTFSSLSPGTYYVFARTAANANYNAGSSQVSAAITLEALPTSVAITPKPVSTTVGQNTQLTATVLPANAANKTVTWSSSDVTVVTVNTLGSVTALAVGQATITARTSNGLTDTCVVTVQAAPVYSLSLAQNGSTDPYVFPSLEGGYTNPGSITLTLTNTGNRSINSLHVALSGANSGSFSVVPGANFTSIEPGATRTLTVSPRTGLVQGTYTADIAVQGDLATSNSFKVSFSVSSAYVPVQSVSIISSILAWGNNFMHIGDTTTHRASILPANATNKKVTWSSSDTRVVTIDQNGMITAVGLGRAVITVTTEDGGKTATSTIEVLTKAYNIALDTTAVAFAEVDPGYRAPTARTIRVTNDGRMPTGALTVSLSGANATSFTLSRTSLTSIAIGASATFTVVPRTALAAGTHTATVTVRGANDIEASFPVSIKVNPGRYSIALDTASHTFPAVDPGYRAPTSRNIRVTNDGNQPTGALAVSLSGANATSFSLSRSSIASIARGGSATFTVVPRTALAAGTHTATVTVRGANAIERSFTVSFEVRPGIYGITLDATAISFSAVDPGYRAPTSRTIRVTNDGNQPTGALTVSLSGTNATSFSLSRSSIASIARAGSATFTVVPRTALAAGTHTATVTVRGANGIERSFTVSFEVRPGIYSIDLDTTAISFAAVVPGYRAPSAHTVRVVNTGNQATGALTLSLSGTNATSFILSRTSLTSIAARGSSTFTIVPRTGLAPGIYEATVNVRGANVMERSSTVRFVVNASVYSVAFDTPVIIFAANAGYRAQSAQTVRVTNDGNQTTGALTIALSGTNATSFTLSRTSLTSIAVGGSSTFTVVPRTGLAAGSYEALVTVRGANGITESFPVRFTVW
ncbi:MAG: choice-of-anchor D domain-containing protein, partial [Coriobacteriia bacterium]|nr:choice-of-anchor D domain-containing protein [Coriobacteriia bacterium]